MLPFTTLLNEEQYFGVQVFIGIWPHARAALDNLKKNVTFTEIVTEFIDEFTGVSSSAATGVFIFRVWHEINMRTAVPTTAQLYTMG